LLVLGGFLDIFKKKISRLRISFFEAVVWLRLLAMTVSNHQNQKSNFLLFWGEKRWVKKRISRKFEKSDFLGFHATTVADTGF